MGPYHRRLAFLGRGVALAAVLVVAGCGARTNLPQVQHGNQPANFQLVTDIPIPPGATMDNERSLILSDHGHWTGRVVMTLWQGVSALTSFYQAQMPAFGWQPLMSVTSGSSVLGFTRGGQVATVQIEQSGLGLTSTVSVTVAPRQGDGGAAGGAIAPEPGQEPSQPGLAPPVSSQTLAPPGQ